MSLFIRKYLLLLRELLQGRYLRIPPGHYYSPLPSKEEFLSVASRVYDSPPSIKGIDLNIQGQQQLVTKLAKWYEELPFNEDPKDGLRYYFNNNFFAYADAVWLYSMMREFKPKRIIEVGSGFSSAVMLDTNELFFQNRIQLVFIEPDPSRLLSILRTEEKESIQIHTNLVQNIHLDVYTELEANDILFIDSSHVVKIGSDVLHILKEILPILKPGVLIHFHDIFYPFEYPRAWLEGGLAWNECYILNAFLQYNDTFKILLFGNYLGEECSGLIEKNMPICMKNIGGSLWLEKLK